MNLAIPQTETTSAKAAHVGKAYFLLSLLLMFCILSNASCILRGRGGSFCVLPNEPNYLLQSPDSEKTPFSGVLHAFNGFNPGQGSLDLSPLMGLRIENAYYQKGASRHGLTGFLGTETAQYELTAEGLSLESAQPMTGRPESDVPVQQLIPESQLHFREYRLYLEIFLPGSAGTHSSALLGANSKDELNRLSEQITKPESVCNSRSAHCTVFPEACSVSVEMQITVNGKRQMAFWGSSLASIADHPHHLKITRLYAGRQTPIKIDASDRGALRLPLLPGDQITWN